jgi:hypothetical protein
MVNEPTEEVTADAETAVAVFVAVTRAPGTTAPLGSVTVPLMPFCTWAFNGVPEKSAARQTNSMVRNAVVGKVRQSIREKRGFCVTASPLSQNWPGGPVSGAAESRRPFKFRRAEHIVIFSRGYR